MPTDVLISPEVHGVFDKAFLSRLRESLNSACRWLTDVALLTTPQPDDGCLPTEIAYPDWRGALRGEYSARIRQWGFFCPYWHSSQGMKALLWAAPHLPDGDFCNEAAMSIADFLMRNRITDRYSPDFGLPLAYEDAPHSVNTSAILEAMDGLLVLADLSGDKHYEQAVIDALDWIERTAYCKGKGVFRNSYDPVRREFFIISSYRDIPEERRLRPLLDDAIFLKGFLRTGKASFRATFFETAERLLGTENPPGNWVSYLPCSQDAGRMHPRHAYWWGGPMLDAWLESGDARHRNCALRAAEWYANALRRDGGFFRNTYTDFSTDSFGHATSGSACAAIVLLRAALECGQTQYFPLVRKALEFCMSVQFTNPRDPNLRGAILEKVLPPDGTDASPYHLRDLSTIFFAQAASLCLKASAYF